MTQDILEIIKEFFVHENFSIWLDNHIIYFIVLGLGTIIILSGIILFKLNKDIQKMDKEKRKRDKNILRFISNKKNKTY